MYIEMDAGVTQPNPLPTEIRKCCPPPHSIIINRDILYPLTGQRQRFN